MHAAVEGVKAIVAGRESASRTQMLLELLTAEERVPDEVAPYLERMQLTPPATLETAVARALLIDELTDEPG